MTAPNRWAVCALALIAAQAAIARPPVEAPDNLIDDRFEIGASLVRSSSATALRVDSTQAVEGTRLDAESDLALPAKKWIGELDVMFRPRDRHRVELNYLFLPFDRHGTTALTQDVSFKDNTYLAGDVVSSELDIKMEGVNYTYSPLRSARYELGIEAGIELIDVLAEANVPSRLEQQREEVSAPVPLLGLAGTYGFSSRWYAQGDWKMMRATVNHIHGSVTLWHLEALYRLNRNVTFGLGFRSYDVTIDSRKPGDTGYFSIKTSGPMISGRVGF